MASIEQKRPGPRAATETMRAAVVEEFARPLVVKQVAKPLVRRVTQPRVTPDA